MIPWRSNFKFLVTGPGRGGTSLLAALLDAHSDLRMGMELGAELLIRKNTRAASPDEAKERLQQFDKACKSFAKGKGFWGNKITTEQFGFAENFGEGGYREQFLIPFLKKRKLIFIVRDGRSCIDSKMQRTGADFATALYYWQHAIKLLRTLHPTHQKMLLVRYENLVKNPTEELKEILAFLDKPFQQEMLDATTSNLMLEDYRQASVDASKAAVPNWPEERWQEIAEAQNWVDRIIPPK